MVDHNEYRLNYAATYDAIPVNFDEVDAAEFIIQNTDNYRGVDAVIDAIGFEAKGSVIETVLTNLKLEGSSGAALRQCIARFAVVEWSAYQVSMQARFMVFIW